LFLLAASDAGPRQVGYFAFHRDIIYSHRLKIQQPAAAPGYINQLITPWSRRALTRRMSSLRSETPVSTTIGREAPSSFVHITVAANIYPCHNNAAQVQVTSYSHNCHLRFNNREIAEAAFDQCNRNKETCPSQVGYPALPLAGYIPGGWIGQCHSVDKGKPAQSVGMKARIWDCWTISIQIPSRLGKLGNPRARTLWGEVGWAG